MGKIKRPETIDSSKFIVPKKILFVDDEVEICDLAREFVPADKYFLEIVHDGLSALRKFEELKPDVVVTDLRMPGMDGLELIEKILTTSPDTQIIVLSARGDIKDAISSLKMGVSSYLSKEDISQLEFEIKEAIKKSAIKKELKATFSEREKALEKTIDVLRNSVRFFGKRKKEFDRDYKSLTKSERKYRSLIDNSPIGIITIDDTYKITEVNPAFFDIMGFDRKTRLKNASILDFQNFIVSGFFGNIHQCIEAKISCTYEHEYFYGGGQCKYIKYTITPIQESDHGEEFSATEILLSVEDITIRKEFEEEQERRAKYCFLTGLLNQNYFMPTLEQAIETAKKNKHRLALVHIDIDNFKDVNDRFGHPVGDQVLKRIGERLKNAVEEEDYGIRYGGDEFFLILVNYPINMLNSIVDRIFKKLSETYGVSNKDENLAIDITFSLGISELDTQTPGMLYEESDIATYNAKHHGKDRVVFFKKGMTMPEKPFD
jgi:diguanylate cyclase (GGDEF)-like protein/PAS domain S-box-containing protein